MTPQQRREVLERFDPTTFIGQDFGTYPTSNVIGSLGIRWEFSPGWTLHARAQQMRLERDQQAVNIRAGTLQANGDFVATTFFDPNQVRDPFSAEAFVIGAFETFGLRHDIAVGAAYSRNPLRFSLISASPNFGTSNIFNPVRLARPAPETLVVSPTVDAVIFTQQAAFVSDLITVTDWLKLFAAVRYADQKNEDRFNPAETLEVTYQDTAFTPNFGILIQPNERLTIYSNYSEGITTGVQIPVNAINFGSTAFLEPARTSQYELGVKAELFTGALFTAAWFDISQPLAALDERDFFDYIGDQRGFAALGMLLLLATGLFIHRKIIAEFFVFRPRRKARRATLDLHNLTSLVGLPFYVLISFSGLLIFAFYYLPWAAAEPFGGDTDALHAEMSGAYQPGERTGRSAPLASLDAMKAEAERLWSAEEDAPVETSIVRVLNHGDENAVVYFRNTFPKDRVVLSKYVAVFDGPSGELIQKFSRPPINEAKGWVEGAHFIQIDHWPMRWLYFIGGLAGCVMIATGMLFWLRARETKHGSRSAGFRVMEAITIASTTGIIAATGAFLVSNRLLPADSAPLAAARADLEIYAFWTVWLGTLAHATASREAAWAQQCWLIAGLAIAAVILNAVTTGHHPIAAAAGGLWPILVMDLLLVAAACLASWAALRLQPERALGVAAIPEPAE